MNRRKKDEGYSTNLVLHSYPGSIHWIGPPEKSLKLYVDKLKRFR
jgi:hypothetical protein